MSLEFQVLAKEVEMEIKEILRLIETHNEWQEDAILSFISARTVQILSRS